ncbi:MAG: hypothetical protein QOI50_3529 [Pseudonocardiales bacterium]|nr:hypothetical protein [Pseudonocardiales bacterium]
MRSLERPGDAAVHRQRDATDIAGFVRDQPGDGVGDFARLDPRGITAASIVDLYPRPDLAFRPIVDIAPTTVELVVKEGPLAALPGTGGRGYDLMGKRRAQQL